jgi:hypothetical protein
MKFLGALYGWSSNSPYFTLIQTQYGSEVFDWLQYEIQYGLYDFV